jgi:hypothetical protein
MKIVFAVLLISASGCARYSCQAPPVPTVKAPPDVSASPEFLTEAEARTIAEQYVKQQGWTVKSEWKSATHLNGEWGVFFNVKNIGGPKIVYVDDRTRHVRWVQGE